MKRLLVVASAVAALVLMQAGTTAEASEWCSDDPAITFFDAQGESHTVYLTSSAKGLEHLAALEAQTYTISVESTDDGSRTKVGLRVIVPDQTGEHFNVRFVVSTSPNGAGTVLRLRNGESGQVSELNFQTQN